MIKLLLILGNLALAKPTKVLMIDAGNPKRDYVVQGVHLGSDTKQHVHSDAMFKFIVAGNTEKVTCENIRVDSCSFMDRGRFSYEMYWFCLDSAILGNYDIVNMSLDGPMYDVIEHIKIMMLKKHSLIVIAAGNSGLNRRGYPSAYATSRNGPIYAVSALNPDGTPRKDSNRDHLTVDFLGTGWYNNETIVGTSVAAALFTNNLIKERCNGK